MKSNKSIIVIGGGASGMVAAISAARLGAEVTILERNPRIGKKILATGNGRCNFTNINNDISYYHGTNPKFAFGALSKFTVYDTIQFFDDLGIEHKVEEQGKVFPMSDQASSILDVLMYELNELGVNIICDALVKSVLKVNDIFEVETENGAVYHADRVIIAAGGRAMPSSGSDGRGYELAIMTGHTIVDTYPSLVQLMLEGEYFKRIDGVKILGTAEVLHNNKSIAKDSGDILFTNYGVSGPPILQLSRIAGELLNKGKEAYIKIIIMDKMSRDELLAIINKRFQAGINKPLDFSFVGLINKRLIPVVLAEAGITDIKRSVAEVSYKQRDKIIDILTDWRFKIRGTKSWQSAQATAGGVDTSQIDSHTMESKIMKGLYFAGEIIDIDGLCGGYNLQWAWSSGYVAGQSAALSE